MTMQEPQRTTIAIIGAGPGTGAASARRFGREGFAVALVSRDQTKLDRLAAELTAVGTTARGFAADVTDAGGLQQALGDAAGWGGPVEVLQYSPVPQREFLKPVPETTQEDIGRALAFSVLGPVAAVEAVLPGMRALGRGTVVFVNGGSAVRPNAAVAGTSIAFAAESAYAAVLHDALAADGVHVAQLIVPGAISPDSADSSPDAVAERIWSIHRDRDQLRYFQTPM
jgi:NADP-dependent 3-hydroxy acid dehydrogenase YdfG